jgi:rRNA-processing protein FCF1
MVIEPNNQTYTEIFPINEDFKNAQETIEKEFVSNDEVVAVTNNKELLQKLQDDLRKAGYKKI